MESQRGREGAGLEQYRVRCRAVGQEHAIDRPLDEPRLHPPGGVAKAHIHVDFDVMIYLLKGSVRHEYGPGCRKSVVHSAGDMFYIEPGLPHEVFNCSDDDWVHAVVSRSDASEWQNIVPYDRDSE